MNAAVCTLFEGDYHYGLGALVNSLYKSGFRGVVWAGYRGPLPPWASPIHEVGAFRDFRVNEGCTIRFIRLEAATHFTYYKPEFMLELFRHLAPDIDTFFYFDPDIVVKCRWSFFEEWATCGVALVQEIVNGGMSATHPYRAAWSSYAGSLGLSTRRAIDKYFNAGFIGIRREWLNTLEIWKQIISGLSARIDMTSLEQPDNTRPFHGGDQDALNLTIMCTDSPLSVVGPEGMDFFPGGCMMSHAVGSPKPWRKKMLWSALSGQGPRLSDKAFWAHTQVPIQLFSGSRLRIKQLDVLLGAAVGRVIRRA